MDTNLSEFTDLPVEDQEKFINACLDYRFGNIDAFKDYCPVTDYILNKLVSSIKLQVLCRALEFTKDSPNKPIIFFIAPNLIEVKLSIILSFDRVDDLLSIIIKMEEIGMLGYDHKFIANADKEHYQILAGVGAVLFKHRYFNKRDIYGESVSELRAVRTLFEFFNAKFSDQDYFDKAMKKHNIKLAKTSLPVLNIIENKRCSMKEKEKLS